VRARRAAAAKSVEKLLIQWANGVITSRVTARCDARAAPAASRQRRGY
jgi:hypothetical protein